jgi:hypothetical protein
MQTSQMIKVMESHAADVTASLQACKESLKGLHANDDERKADIVAIEKEVLSLKDTIPKVREI